MSTERSDTASRNDDPDAWVSGGHEKFEAPIVPVPDGERPVANPQEPLSWSEEACQHCKGYAQPTCTCTPKVIARREERAAAKPHEPRLDRSGWMSEHPATGELVEVVTAEWFYATRDALRDLLAHIPNGTALDRYKGSAYRTLGRTEFERWERTRGD